jgi:NAD(P)H-dependent flavin oxidoreductase YrpB (nitropropane dioxygenase family)
MTSNQGKFFDCRYPIVCAAMNQVSDAGLAIAVHNAGAFPSLSIPNYIKDNGFDMQAYTSELHAYKEATGSDNLLLSVGSRLLLSDAVIRPFLDLGFRHIELFHWASTEPGWKRVIERSRRLAGEMGVKFVFKISTGHVTETLDYPTVLLKGPEGAGRSADNAPPLPESFEFCRAHLPATNVIVSGGIWHADQVTDYLNHGALAVAVGSLFAASKESSVADSVKAQIIASASSDLQSKGGNNLRGLFSKVAEGDNANLTRTLAKGIRNAGDGGVFMGNAVDHITKILSVREIVERLVGSPG